MTQCEGVGPGPCAEDTDAQRLLPRQLPSLCQGLGRWGVRSASLAQGSLTVIELREVGDPLALGVVCEEAVGPVYGQKQSLALDYALAGAQRRAGGSVAGSQLARGKGVPLAVGALVAGQARALPCLLIARAVDKAGLRALGRARGIRALSCAVSWLSCSCLPLCCTRHCAGKLPTTPRCARALF